MLVAWTSWDFRHPRSASEREKQVHIDGMGLLEIIWLYRNHIELQELLEQVEVPTASNLRRAGLVPTQMAGLEVGDVAKRVDVAPDSNTDTPDIPLLSE
jgi:hypothetical protein